MNNLINLLLLAVVILVFYKDYYIYISNRIKDYKAVKNGGDVNYQTNNSNRL